MAYEGILESAERITRMHRRAFRVSPPELGIAHNRLDDDRAPIEYALSWERGSRETLRCVVAHHAANPGPFDFSPPQEGRTIKCIYVDGVQYGASSGAMRQFSVRIRELIATD